MMKGSVQVDHACLAIIAFSAGAELQIGDVRRIKKQVCALCMNTVSAGTEPSSAHHLT